MLLQWLVSEAKDSTSLNLRMGYNQHKQAKKSG